MEVGEVVVGYLEKKGYGGEKVKGWVKFEAMRKMMEKGKEVRGVIGRGKEVVERVGG